MLILDLKKLLKKRHLCVVDGDGLFHLTLFLYSCFIDSSKFLFFLFEYLDLSLSLEWM